MKLTILGKYGPFPKAGGACSSYLIEDGDTKVLLDLGSGTFSRALERIALDSIDAVVITHFHYDHCSDLGVMKYALEKMPAMRMKVFSSPTNLIGEPFEHHMAFDGDTTQIGSLKLQWFQVIHSVPCLAVRVTNRDGSSLFYTGDTAYFEELSKYAVGADVILADTCLLEREGNAVPMHMTAVEAGTVAKKAGAKKLLCTHIYGGIADENEVLKRVGFDNAIVVEEGATYEVGNGNG